jgi:hypothetical protein
LNPVVVWMVVGVEFAGLVALAVLLIVARHKLKGTRRELGRQDKPRRRRSRGLAPVAIRTGWQTADSLIKKGVGATVRNSIEDLAGWARVERPDLARLTADGQVVIVFSDIEGSTELNDALGDREWVKLLEQHNKLFYKHVDEHGGHVVKTQGDGFMIAFADSGQAVLCSVGVQQALHDDPERWMRSGCESAYTWERRCDAATISSGAMSPWRRGWLDLPVAARSWSASRFMMRSPGWPVTDSGRRARSNSRAFRAPTRCMRWHSVGQTIEASAESGGAAAPCSLGTATCRTSHIASKP